MDAKLVRWADRLAWVAAGMAGVAALAGLATGVYRDDALMVAQARGQDIVTLFGAVPILAVGLALARRGSFACRVVAVGALAFLVYGYAIFAFQVTVSPVTPLHIGVFGLATWSLGLIAVGSRAIAADAAVGSRLPRRTTAIVLLVVAILFAATWLRQIVTALVTGALPPDVVALDLPTSAVYTLDLAFALPVLAAVGVALARGARLAPAFAVGTLVFSALMAASVLALFVVEAASGLAVDLSMTPAFAAICVVTSGLLVVSLRPVLRPRTAVAPTAA